MNNNPVKWGPVARRLFGVTVILLLTACAATTKTAGHDEHALVCPQCKMVAVTERSYSHVTGAYRTVYHHRCPGCQSVIDTFVREGKWQHKCSICKDAPFICPVIHPAST
jgi:hypothetical protein